MTTKFVSVEDFALRSGLGDIDGVAEDVQTKSRMAIEAATTHLISIVRTEFDDQVNTDIYYSDAGEMPFVGDFPRYFLSQGFVTTPVSGFDLHIHNQLDDLANPNYHIDTKYMLVDAVKGTLLLTGSDQITSRFSTAIADGAFVRIVYQAGFTSKADAFGTIYENAPDWLTEAAMILAIAIFATGKACEDDDKNSSGCPCSIEALVNRYIRFLPSALKPMS